MAEPDRSVVTFNALALQTNGSGVQTYIRELLAALAKIDTWDMRAHAQASAKSLLPASVQMIAHADSRGTRRAVEGMRLPSPERGLMHGLDIDLPVRGGQPMVATVHDLAVFDVPWAFPGWRWRAERLLVTNAMRRADRLVAVSEFTARQVQKRFGRTCTVTHLAPRSGLSPASQGTIEIARENYRLPDRFVLHLGTVEPRKNVAGLAAACASVGVPLVLAGAALDAVPHAADIDVLGYVPDDDLPALFGAATVVAYPSRYEGFGLPPIEAMACGAPVLATAVGALPEVLGDDVPLARPDDQEQLTDLLGDMMGDDGLRATHAAAGAAAVARLSWTTTAQQTIDVYEELMGAS